MYAKIFKNKKRTKFPNHEIIRKALLNNYNPKKQKQYAKVELSQEIVLSIGKGIIDMSETMVDFVTEGLMNER